MNRSQPLQDGDARRIHGPERERESDPGSRARVVPDLAHGLDEGAGQPGVMGDVAWRRRRRRRCEADTDCQQQCHGHEPQEQAEGDGAREDVARAPAISLARLDRGVDRS